MKVPLISLDRFRLGTDGIGVTTLIAFWGCRLRCKYCLNPHCYETPPRVIVKTAEEIMNILKKDELYFRVTNGGATFGGGEPMFYSKFIIDLLELGAKNWNTTVETSLNCRREHVERLLPYVNSYIVDVKDMNSEIYESYTGRDNKDVIENLKYLVKQGKSKNILCRIPLIKDFNNSDDQKQSINILKDIGITNFNIFEYDTIVGNQKIKEYNTVANTFEKSSE